MRRKKILYISYDGMGEPLGQSQVKGYLEGLAETYDITLLSFEKVNHSREALSQQMVAAGIDWHPMTYHGRPPLISTLLDIFNGTRFIRRLCR